MFIHHEGGFKKEQQIRIPKGIAVSHVDDILNGGNKVFKQKIMEPLKKSFQFGSHEKYQF